MQGSPTGSWGARLFLATRNSTNPYPYIRLYDYAVIVRKGHKKTDGLSPTDSLYPRS
jgi:hypothetical protein